MSEIIAHIWWLHFVTLACVAADVATTVYALKKYPTRIHETNGEAESIQKKLGVFGGSVLFKLPALMIFWPGFPAPAMVAFGGFHLWQAWQNWKVIQRVAASNQG